MDTQEQTQAPNTESQQQDGSAEETQESATSAETENTDTDAPTAPDAEHMIPKSRFDEINAELKKLRQEREQAQREREAAERQAAEQQGKYKELYEQELAKREEAEAQARALELSALRRKVAEQVGLPAALAERLQGEDEEKLVEDAKALLASLPRPSAPNTNSGGGDGNVPGANTDLGGLSPQEFAARYGLNPQTVEQLSQQ